ncbi:MAG: hypothetical protein K2X43_13185 [Hyphomonadaceae bacterium]|jgi:hypothetical protein|nr:hypothetical protein [Hyphomonadaceae bacterium]
MHDRRNLPRHGLRIEGKLLSPDMTFSIDVVIRNLSEDGALIVALASADLAPERVYLWQMQTRTLFECRVRWRRADRLMGLRFTERCNRSSVRDLMQAAAPAPAALRPDARSFGARMPHASSCPDREVRRILQQALNELRDRKDTSKLMVLV